jgi:hypothetical protein
MVYGMADEISPSRGASGAELKGLDIDRVFLFHGVRDVFVHPFFQFTKDRALFLEGRAKARVSLIKSVSFSQAFTTI